MDYGIHPPNPTPHSVVFGCGDGYQKVGGMAGTYPWYGRRSMGPWGGRQPKQMGGYGVEFLK